MQRIKATDPLNLSDPARQVADVIAESISDSHDGKTLYVPIGEHHSMPTHVLFGVFVAHELIKRSIRFGVALEYPSNLVEIVARTKFSKKIAGTFSWLFRRRANQADLLLLQSEIAKNPTSHPMLYVCAALADKYMAPVSQNARIRFLRERQIPIAFVDAAQDASGFLDPTDGHTREAFEEHGVPLQTRVSPITSLGIAIRNQHMVNASVRFSASIGEPPVVLICTGAAHLFGYEPPEE